MNDILVSIIIPVYNAEEYLRTCLDSVLGQTYKKIEIICVNDGSTDNSLSILQEYVDLDDRLIVFDIVNDGVSNARNLALNKARGSMIMFVDADDWLDLDCIERLLSFSIQYECEIVMFPYISERESRSTKRDLFHGEQVFKGNECRDLARLMIGPIGNEVSSPTKLDSYGTVWGKLYQKDILHDILFVDLKRIGSAEDSLFNMFVFRRAEVVGYLPDIYYHYRRNNISSLTNSSHPNLKDKRKVMYTIITDNFMDLDDKEALSNRIALDVLGLLIIANESASNHKEIKELLNDELFNTALKGFNISYLPIHWKMFYLAAKWKCYLLILGFLFVFKLIRGRKL